MAKKFQDNRRNIGKKTATAITTSQRSVCNVVIYRWNDTDITELFKQDVSSTGAVSLGGNSAATGNLVQKSRVIIRNDVIRCNINKNKGGSSGNFSLTLKRGKKVRNGRVLNEDIDYLDVIHPGDWIMIYIKKSGGITLQDLQSTRPESGIKMIGVIENVRYIEVDDPGTASPRLEYVVTGRDFGKVFENNIFFNPTLNGGTASTLIGAQLVGDASKSIKGINRPAEGALTEFTPDQIVKKLIGFFLGDGRGASLDGLNSTHQPWYVPAQMARVLRPNLRNRSQVSAADIIDTSKIGLQSYSRNDPVPNIRQLLGANIPLSPPSEGTVWSMLEFFQNPIINELYTELTLTSDGTLQPALIHRQFPFSNKPGETSPFTANTNKSFKQLANRRNQTFFVDLPRHSILSSDIRQKNVGKADHERMNYVIVVPRSGFVNNDKLFKAVSNIPSIQRYGIRIFQGETPYILQDENQLDLVKICELFSQLIADWFFHSHQLYNGTLVIDGRDEHIEIGNNLFISDVKQLYHIEGYTHTYEVRKDAPTIYNTELRVSRGQVLERGIARFIGPSQLSREQTTITTSTLEGIR